MPLHSVRLLRNDRLALALLVNAVDKKGSNDGANNDNIAQQKLKETLESLCKARNSGSHGGKQRGDDPKDGANEVLEQADDAAENGGDGGEDGGDEASDGIDD